MSPGASTWSRGRSVLVSLLLFAATFALYCRTRAFPFIEYDDPSYVRDNPHLADGLTLETLRWAFTSAGYAYNWHPLTWLSHALDVSLFGPDAGGHHLVNAALHALNALLAFQALRALTERPVASAWVAALFAAHPLRVESVAWISERKELLAGACFFWCLIEYAHYARAPSRGGMARVALALALGLSAKPTLVTLPFLLLVLDVWPLRRWRRADSGSRSAPTILASLAPTHPGEVPRKTTRGEGGYTIWREKLPLFALSLGAIAVTLFAQHSGGALNTALPWSARLANAPLAYVTYLRQHFLPTGLAVFYPHPAIVDPERSRLGLALLACGVLGALGAAALRRRRDFPWLALGLCWFLGILVPMLGVVQVGDQAHADRYAYLATIGIDIALVLGAARLLERRPSFVPLVAGAGCALLVAWSALTSRQLDAWRDSETLFSRALEVTSENYVAHNNLGLALGNAGKLEDARAHFREASSILPGFYPAELNLGKACYKSGELEEAERAFARAAAIRPREGEARFNLGVVLAARGQFERADEELQAALRLAPEYGTDPRFRTARQALDARLRRP